MFKFTFLLIGALLAVANAAPRSLIVGGFFAEKNQFPYQVSMQFRGQHFCGGSIVNENFILTAAHCVDISLDWSQVEIVVGTIDDKTGQRFRVAKKIPHEKYISNGHFYDVALVKLENPLTFSESVQPISLNDKTVPGGSEVTISGWGDINNSGQSPEFLKYNVLLTATEPDCTEALDHQGQSFLCLLHEIGQSACSGDSGGPAVVGGKLVGIANAVMKGCEGGMPNIYAKVSDHIPWIQSHLTSN